jgi:hypothetical protein
MADKQLVAPKLFSQWENSSQPFPICAHESGQTSMA